MDGTSRLLRSKQKQKTTIPILSSTTPIRGISSLPGSVASRLDKFLLRPYLLLLPSPDMTLESFADIVVIAFVAVSGYHFADESGKEQHYADNQRYKCKVEEWLVRHRSETQTVSLIDQLFNDKPDCDYTSDEKCHKSCKTEEMHRFLSEFAQEPE